MKRCGTIYTFCVVHSCTEAFQAKTPYVLAVVEDNRQKLMARVEGYMGKMDIAVGMEVRFLAEDEKGNPIYTFD